ncbi:MAG: MarR family protein [Acidimicrobiaceae bacterium]|nr:MarR family protein [Acidimicrobiaceae bacterium]
MVTEHLTNNASGLSSYDGVVDEIAGHRDDVGDVSGCQDALADDLGWGLGMIFRAYVKAANAAVADLAGGPRGYQVLSAAAQGTVASQLALAQHLGVDRTVMTYLLDDLEAARLIERRPDPADRRARRIVATQQGNELLTSLNDRLRAAEEYLLAPLGTDKRDSFRAQIRLLATQLDAIDPADSPCELADGVDAEIPASRQRVQPARSR